MCGSSQYHDGQNLIQIFLSLMDILANKVNEKGWAAESIYGTSFAMYALGQCHHDLDSKQCVACFTKARESLPKCLPSLSGRIYLDGCFLRYDNYQFFNESKDETHDKCDCQGPPKYVQDNPSFKLGFEKQVMSVVSNVTKDAAKHKFAVGRKRGGVEKVFALAQCWETVDEMKCKDCLERASQSIHECVPGAEGKCMYTGCFMRYSTTKFFNDDEEKVSSKFGLIIAGILSAIGLIFLISLGVLLSWQGAVKSKTKNNKKRRMPSFSSATGLNFRYEFLEKATDCFHPSRKLGQGGAGSVFKGTLPSGRTIAVKRLFFNTRQWADGFFNEVNLISGIEHKNLVKLMGCSIEGPESLLVYEYLPNKSLDQVIFKKADVYALGVVIIEIVCGQKNSIFTEGSSSILHLVWKNYNANSITRSVDPALNGNFCEEEASIALRIGLLCVQSSVSQRPLMAEVLQMLTNHDYIIPSPRHQPFLNSSVMSPDDRTKTSTMSFLSPLNVHIGVGENSSSQSHRSSTSSEHSTSENSFSGTTMVTPEPR
ncbi:cysteine-rich receptor-like protein kinase 1 [Senna tora]|uniref:Cysteine-rich receptor-like protein kinase 1 n=1 Tax=Senna tora TaxID=362788 RepID=A0A834SLQ1_9FABA|nr:cysteine-rich receptor-like protein kinase 1 [Senna tora]